MSMNNLWDTSDYVRVIVKDIEVEARVGIHPWEKHPERLNRLIVNVEMFAHIGKDSESNFIDYDTLHNTLRQWPTRPHTLLLETLVEEVIALCFKNERVEACRVSIVKPDIFNDAKAAGVEIYRVRKKI